MWMDHDEFMPLVKKVWDQNSGGCPMYQLCCKLRKLKQELKLFNMAHFSNISDGVKDAKKTKWIRLNRLCIQRMRIQF